MNIDKLKGEIASKHRVLLQDDDPTLVLGTVFEAYLKEGREALSKEVIEALNQTEAYLVGAEASAKKVATDIVNRGADWLDQKFRETGDQLLERMTARLSVQIEQANDAVKQVRLFSYLTMLCTFLSVLVLVVDVVTR